MSDEQLRQLMRETVSETLLGLGIADQDPIAMQRDFAFLRQWRSSTESIRSKAMLTAVGLVVTAAVGYLWLAFKKP